MKMAGHVIAFRGEDDDGGTDVLIELGEFRQDGRVEISFSHGKEELYVSFPLPQLLEAIAKENGSE